MADGKANMLIAKPFGIFIYWLTTLTHSLPLAAVICSALLAIALRLVRRLADVPSRQLSPILPDVIAVRNDNTLSHAEKEERIGDLYRSVKYTPFTMLIASLIPIFISILMFLALANPVKCVFRQEVGEWANGMKQYDIIQDERYTQETGIDATSTLCIGSHNLADSPYKGDSALLVIPALVLVCGCVRQLLHKKEITTTWMLLLSIIGCVTPAIVFVRLPAILGLYALTTQITSIATVLINKFIKRRTAHGQS